LGWSVKDLSVHVSAYVILPMNRLENDEEAEVRVSYAYVELAGHGRVSGEAGGCLSVMALLRKLGNFSLHKVNLASIYTR
jgi:hypothetical protein